jgi:flagellar biosynthesis protein FliR
MIDLKNVIGLYFFHSNPADLILLFLLVFTRCLTMTLITPFLGAQILPSIVRVGISVVLSTTVIFPLLSQTTALSELAIFSITMLFLKEALLGFVLGFLASLIFFAYELFGEFVDLARAANMSKLLVPELKHQSSSMATLFFQLALVMTCVLGFDRQIIASIYQSFLTFPINQVQNESFSLDFMFDATVIFQALFKIALELSFPVIIISCLIDLAFGLMNRVAPQINAYFLSLPAKMVGGLLMLFFLLPFLLEDFVSHYHLFSRFYQSIIAP